MLSERHDEPAIVTHLSNRADGQKIPNLVLAIRSTESCVKCLMAAVCVWAVGWIFWQVAALKQELSGRLRRAALTWVAASDPMHAR